MEWEYIIIAYWYPTKWRRIILFVEKDHPYPALLSRCVLLYT